MRKSRLSTAKLLSLAAGFYLASSTPVATPPTDQRISLSESELAKATKANAEPYPANIAGFPELAIQKSTGGAKVTSSNTSASRWKAIYSILDTDRRLGNGDSDPSALAKNAAEIISGAKLGGAKSLYELAQLKEFCNPLYPPSTQSLSVSQQKSCSELTRLVPMAPTELLRMAASKGHPAALHQLIDSARSAAFNSQSSSVEVSNIGAELEQIILAAIHAGSLAAVRVGIAYFSDGVLRHENPVLATTLASIYASANPDDPDVKKLAADMLSKLRPGDVQSARSAESDIYTKLTQLVKAT